MIRASARLVPVAITPLFAMLNDSLYSSEKMDWETPDHLFLGLDAEFAFTLDVAASKENAKCRRYFTAQDDGLTQPWEGTCWMNPPYGREVGDWMRKAVEESKRGVLTVALVPARTDTRWWHETAMKHEIRFLARRLSFKGSNNKAPFPCAVVVIRPPHAAILSLANVPITGEP